MKLVSDGPLKLEVVESGACWHLQLAAPPGNILDSTMIDAVTAVFRRASESPDLKAIVLEGEGDQFSFGASVEEHRPEAVAAMLTSFHQMFHSILDAAVFTAVAIRGSCLGGGLELASICHRVFARPDAKLGQPEIVLGVFAPVASVVLPERMGRPAAEDLCLSGRVISGEEAHRLRLVDEIAENPSSRALEYVSEHLLPRSASSLRFAVRAARSDFGRRFRREITSLENLYLDELMGTADAKEGIDSFLEKRKPEWRNR